MNRWLVVSPVLALAFHSLALPVCGQLQVVNPLSAERQATFFHLPEGGAVMPLAFYDAIDVVDSQSGLSTGQTFAERMGAYGFLDDRGADLPVGFGRVSLDFLGGLPGLNLNCAACHVGELHYQGRRLRVLGGPNLADARWFSQDVYLSIRSLLTRPGQLVRLLVRLNRLQPETVVALRDLPLVEHGRFEYLAGSPDAERLLAQVARWGQQTSRQRVPGPFSTDVQGDLAEAFRSDREAAVRSGASFRPGIRRNSIGTAAGLFGAFDEVNARDDVRLAFAAGRSEPSSAAVDLYRNVLLILAETEYFLAQGRYPLTTREGFGRLDAFGTVRFLLFPEESAEKPFTAPVSVPHLWGTGRKKWLHWNANTNSTLQRNIIQALGVGALAAPGGVNNVLVPNLHTLETISESIAAPPWPEGVFGPLDEELAARGQELYAERCASCHEAGRVDPATGLIEYPLFSLAETGTDPNDARNFHQPVGARSFAAALGEEALKLQTWSYRWRDPGHPVPIVQQLQWSGGAGRVPAVWRDPLSQGEQGPVYAGLPLTGVWATAPYLHNNSVPTLRDLLKPAANRPAVFRVGHRDYDPVDVGYAQPADPSEIPVLERFDTRADGNSNTGHEGARFGSDGLTEDDVEALLEYLKSL